MRLSSLRLLLILVVGGAAVACADEQDPFEPTSIAGSWSLEVDVSNAAAAVRCTRSGLISLSLDGSTIHGAGSFPRLCSGVTQTVATVHEFTGVLVDATTVRWHDTLGCTFTGRRITADELAGDVVCTVLLHERDVTLTGVWRATR